MSEILSRIADRHPLSSEHAEDGRYTWPERWNEAHDEIAALEAERDELKAKLEAMERQAKAHSMLHNPPSSDAPISAWQRWKQDTDAAIAAAQEEPPLRRRNEPNQSNP